jgi:hypothetical protein
MKKINKLFYSILVDNVQICLINEAEGYMADPTRRPAWLAGWRRVTQPAGCEFIRDGRSMPDHTTCPGQGLIHYTDVLNTPS